MMLTPINNQEKQDTLYEHKNNKKTNKHTKTLHKIKSYATEVWLGAFHTIWPVVKVRQNTVELSSSTYHSGQIEFRHL